LVAELDCSSDHPTAVAVALQPVLQANLLLTSADQRQFLHMACLCTPAELMVGMPDMMIVLL
jgi:hypothetical protein